MPVCVVFTRLLDAEVGMSLIILILRGFKAVVLLIYSDCREIAD
jgi:hypothetical protein